MTIPSSTRFLEEVREFVTSHAVLAGFDEMTVEQMKMAVDEACTNVIEHSYGGQSGQPVDITINVDPNKFVVVIRDKGRQFDQQAYREPDLIQYAKTKNLTKCRKNYTMEPFKNNFSVQLVTCFSYHLAKYIEGFSRA